MSRIIINGSSFDFDGPLSLINGKWYDGNGNEIDMNNLESVRESKTINITIEGNVERLKIDCCDTVTVNGNCHTVDTGSGNVSCRIIEGNADTGSGNVTCETIEGDADTGSGNIYCDNIKGRAETCSGTINGRRSGGYGHGHSSVVINGMDVNDFVDSVTGRGGRTRVKTYGEVITGGMTITNVGGRKVMTVTKNTCVNGTRIGDMTEEELKEWIDAKAKKGTTVIVR